MVIIYSDDFFDALSEIRNFIALDSKSRADKFTKNLRTEIEKIASMPYSYRKNFDAENENVRDLIYKGYIVPFYVDSTNGTIAILLIYKENLPKINFKNLKEIK